MIGSSIMAFGLYNVHSLSGVTEGGILGMTLLLNYWLDLSPAITGFIMNAACYLVGWKLLGWSFILYSTIAGFTFSASYAVFEQFPRLWPGLADMPLTAAIVGALFIGIGAGLCVRAGGAPSGRRRPGHEHLPCYKERYPDPVPGQRPAGAGAVLILSGSEAHRRIPFNGGAVGPADRIRSECAGAPGGGIKRQREPRPGYFPPVPRTFQVCGCWGIFFV